MCPPQRRYYSHGSPALPPPTQVSTQGCCSELSVNLVHQNKPTGMRKNAKSTPNIFAQIMFFTPFNVTSCRTICSTNIPFLVESVGCANDTFPTHGNSWQQGKYFPILLTGWVIWAKIGIVMSLKLMPRVDTEYSALQKTNCNFNDVCVNLIFSSGY